MIGSMERLFGDVLSKGTAQQRIKQAHSSTVLSTLNEGGPSLIKEIKLILDGMRATDLVDTGSFLDPQDPALYISVGGSRVFNTARKKDAKTEAVFTGERFEVDIDPAEVRRVWCGDVMVSKCCGVVWWCCGVVVLLGVCLESKCIAIECVYVL